MKRILTVAALVLLSGCAAMREPGEIAYQTAHAYDVIATNKTVGDPCFAEGGQITEHIIGRHPSHAGVAAWGAGFAVGHALVTEALLDHGHPTIAKVWEWVSFADTAVDVGRSWSAGVRIGSPNRWHSLPAGGCGY